MADSGSAKDKTSAREASQLADIDKYVEDEGVDKSKAQEALSSIQDDHQKELEAKIQREKELAKVKVSKTNVEFLVKEMEMTKDAAERQLKIHKDDVVLAVRELLAS
mmetsp:Transcript_20732/g.41871  ORF Transcript_20732/g.41871 Transcript_20732/m.41871 type:complete len:107 (-) Transcript_20732:143-463(-)|eukprot:CAMPEP_0167795156 /NCGR_PEP_ID=MMETSP0111_2-20121227/14270_1 /TAXON_ID=91324 /ORGANISM="Lotharella globosa, Strain CCCM811" /LENGTH=106 /DNA_ID=CAMNT_0007688775 /DNA_START=8 /DNA_END=328 /DNA_ORIENTATION=+